MRVKQLQEHFRRKAESASAHPHPPPPSTPPALILSAISCAPRPGHALLPRQPHGSFWQMGLRAQSCPGCLGESQAHAQAPGSPALTGANPVWALLRGDPTGAAAHRSAAGKRSTRKPGGNQTKKKRVPLASYSPVHSLHDGDLTTVHGKRGGGGSMGSFAGLPCPAGLEKHLTVTWPSSSLTWGGLAPPLAGPWRGDPALHPRGPLFPCCTRSLPSMGHR